MKTSTHSHKAPNKLIMLVVSVLIFAGMVVSGIPVFAQGVCISDDGSTPNAKALLELKSTTTPGKGFLVARMASGDLPVTDATIAGMLVWQTDVPIGYYYCDGAAWLWIGAGWGLTGNSGTNEAATRR